jgi:branched-chain amino acid transport system permease protein
MSRLRAYPLGLGIAVAVFSLLVPFIFPQIGIHLAVEVLIYALFAVSFNILFGYCGMLPFGHAAFFGVGAYTFALMFKHFPGTPLLLGFLAAALLALVIGALIGFFCVRLSGPYFSLISIASQMFLFAVALKWRSVTSGDDGMTFARPELYLPILGGISMRNVVNIYYFTLIVVAVAIWACYLFLKTPLGNSLVCIREQEKKASFLGYNVYLVKLAAFLASSVLAGLAGGLFTFFQAFVGTSYIDLNMSMSVVVMTVIGGKASFLGPVLGTIFYIVFQDWMSSLTNYWMIVLGITFIVIVLYAEGGLISLFKNERVRLWLSRLNK